MTESMMSATAQAVDGAIVCRGIGHVYRGGTVALDGVDLTIGRGVFGLLGPNGAGKSTLMRILCTLLVPTSGTATVSGHDVVRQRGAVRKLLGYLPQEFSAWRLQRVEETLDTLALLSGLTDKAARQRRVSESLSAVGLADVRDRKVKALSGGMKRRLGVAQALVHDPPVLIVDEPTVGLDPEERIRFRQVMTGLSEERIIVLSTHIVSDLGAGCRDLAIIDAGKVIYRGSPGELLEAARGRVFEAVLPAGGEDRLGQGIEVVSRLREGVGVRVRAVAASGAMPSGAEEISDPTLEEAYLAFMVDRGRADVARVAEEGS